MKKAIVFVLVLVAVIVLTLVVAAEGPAAEGPSAETRRLAEKLIDDAAPDDVPTDPCSAESNLLINQSFEGQYTSYIPPNGHPDCQAGVCTTAQMADGWSPWWRSKSSDPDDTDVNPEYKPAEAVDFPNRVVSGERAQQYFTFYRTHEAGMWQQVSGLTPGTTYCFSIWGHSWSADDDDDALSGPAYGVLQQKVGIDPTGGNDWQSGDIIWSAEREQYDVFGLFKITVEAQADTITVFTYSNPVWSVKHNDVYWDDAILSSVASPAPALVLSSVYHAFWAEVGNPGILSAESVISITHGTTGTWSATLAPGGTFTPMLTPTNGNAGDALTITTDSTGFATGVYTATVTVTTDPSVVDSPGTIELELYVVEEIHRSFVPLLVKSQ
jgi:hypothetical protein